MDDRPDQLKKWLIRLAKLVVLLLVAWGVHRTVAAGVDKLSEEWRKGAWRLHPLWLAAAGAFYLAGLVPCGWFWQRVLAGLGEPAGLAKTMRAYFIGHLGKYVPGKAMVVILRTGMVRGPTGSTAAVAVSVFYETLTSMAVGAFLAAIILLIEFPRQRLFILLSLGVLAAAGLPTLPPVFRRVVRLIRANDSQAAERISQVGYGNLALGWLAIGAGWWLVGLSVWTTLRALGVSHGDWLSNWPLYTAAAALATVAGFVSLIPGGLLVRESVLLELLVLLPGVDAGAALAAAIVLRLVWLVAEALISVILYPLK